MSQKSKIVLKTKFEAGQIPTEEDFGDLLDSSINKVDDQVAIRNVGRGLTAARYVGIGSVDPESPLSIRNRGKKQNLLGFEDADGNEKWQIQIDPEKGGEGLNLSEKDSETSNLFIRTGGNVGIGTKIPTEKLSVKGNVEAEKFIGTIDWNSLQNIPLTLLVPKGIIVMWSGSSDDIPDGWVLCNGEGDVPDLQDRFIVGAGNSYSVKDEGGEEKVTLSTSQMPSHRHSVNLTTNSNGNHSHRVNADKGDGGGNGSRFDMTDGSSKGAMYTDSRGAHSHSVNGHTGYSGSTQSHENRPPYYALCFILKT